ncbi:DUF3108 domain-containing protein [uncultured Aquitalea sp.]|uniref:DUF3108 domain-containing protein n=1 Tax=uncultured Aquitalea sp. TaxID=540272 RepID=UPI0025F10CF3|nr:DUF3108 domain-containing protein [uncultured Aquitalea sp.]
MKKPLRVFTLALLLSLLMHIAFIGSGLLPDATIDLQPEKPLRKIDVKMRALAAEPDAAAPAAPTARLGGIPVKGPKPVKKPRREASVPKAETSAPAREASAPQMASPASAPAAEKPGLAEASAPASASRTHKNASEPVAASAPATEKKAGYVYPPAPLTGFPHKASLQYQGFRNDILVGSGSLEWQRGDGRYRLEENVSALFGKIKIRYLSEGGFTNKQGLKPDSMQAWKNGEAKESARFDYDAGQLIYGDPPNQNTPLKTGALDVFSLAFQLGLKGGELGNAPLQVTTGKKVYEHPIAPSGEADYDFGSAKIRVIVYRVSGRAAEFWLSPDFANLPVRIVFTDNNNNRMDLRAVLINVDGTEQWKLPLQPTRRNKNDH